MTLCFGRFLGLCCTVAGAAAQSGWQQMQPTNVPPARALAHVAYDPLRSVTIMFGGSGPATSLGASAFGDTWEWNGSDWTARSTAQTPPARYGGGFGYDLLRGRAVLFGGTASSHFDLSDTWEYDGSTW